MAIKNINKNDFQQKFYVSKEDKIKYGEIYTPFSLIEDMFNMLPEESFKDKTAKWLDPGAGTGYFSIYLYWKLMEGLSSVIKNKTTRHNHIINKMIYMIEIKSANSEHLKNLFGENANILCENFTENIPVLNDIKFDYIIGNPPYNADGMKKVPTNTNKNKKEDGKTIWISFVKKALSLLKPQGNLLFIIPSIWMKPDKARTYHLLTQYKIKKLKCLTNTETNSYFKGEAQTPTCYFVLENTLLPNDGNCLINLYDKDRKEYIEYKFHPDIEEPIPVFGAAIIAKLKQWVEKVGHMNAIKTNLPNKDAHFSPQKDIQHPYLNIKTCKLGGADNLSPILEVNYSNKAQAYSGKKKLVLAHKMYGFPYFDRTGEYGISNRDNYVIINSDYTDDDFIKLRDFLSTKTALYLFETTRYRMKYLEKYAFELIPDIIKLSQQDENVFPKEINDKTIADYFDFNEIDRENIEKLHKKNYDFTFSH